jgi:sulfite reductase beta subunit-like hemoprotein
MSAAPRGPRPPGTEPDWDLVRKRNLVERLKHEKGGMEVIHDLPAMIASGYEAVPEEDFVRLQWYGLYHDKPKLGFFMMRVKLPGGVLSPAKLRAIGEISVAYGRGHGELTTRQNVQLHWLAMARLPEVLARLEAAGLSTAGACGDNVRNITACPVAGLAEDELFDCRDLVKEAAAFFLSRPEYADLPRKHKITIAACARQCNAPEIHCIALVGTLDAAGRQGFAVRVGGGLSSFPRLADDLGVFVPREEAIPVLQAIVDVWREDRRYRLSRARARLKFMVDDLGPAVFRARVEERLGCRLADGAAPPAPPEGDHAGVHPQRQPGLLYAGFPVYLGLMNGEQMIALADLAASYGGGIRLTRRQNFLLTDIPKARLDEALAGAAAIGFPIDAGGLRGLSIACTGDPFCNFTVAETKGKLREIVEHLEAELGPAAADLKINLDGCPHACAHHWVGDIGLQGTTLRERGATGEKLHGYDLFLRGGLGSEAAIGRPVLRRVPGDVVHQVIERLYRAYLAGREEGEPIQRFFARASDEDLAAVAGMASASSDNGRSAETA